MKRNLSILPILLTLLTVSCGNKQAQPELKTAEDTLAWAIGENIAQSITSMGNAGLKIDNEIVLQAIRNTIDGKPQPIDDSTYTETLRYFANLIQGQQAQSNPMNPVAKQEREYMAKLKAENPNIKEHPSGFLYEVLKEGHGPNAKYAQSILFDYRSYLMLTGEPYDQTYGKRPPIPHVVGKPMFEGLIYAFQLMNEGSIYRFYFPYELAFGEEGAGPIPGYTPFIYEIELHKISNK